MGRSDKIGKGQRKGLWGGKTYKLPADILTKRQKRCDDIFSVWLSIQNYRKLSSLFH